MSPLNSCGLLTNKPDESIRPSLLIISCATTVAASLCLIKGFPFHYGFCVACGLSTVLHLTAFFFFRRLIARPLLLEGIVMADLALLGFIIHFTGGLMSPFVFFYFWILASATIYGLPDRYGTALAVVSYASLILAEAYGIITPWGNFSTAVYQSKLLTMLIVSAIMLFILMTRYITGLIVVNLRFSLEREMGEKEGLFKKFSELNATTQLGVLAHRIAHDLRGPISSISGYIQIEMAREKTAEEVEQLNDLNEVVDNMANSLNSITRFGKAQQVPGERICLTDFIGTLLAIVSYSPQARGIKFVKLYNEKSAVSVLGSRPDLQQAYFNIFKNAVEAVRDNADGKRIEIGIKSGAKDAEITISDNGPGIAPELLSTLFKKSITTKKEGTGVGLLITRDLLLRNDGDIEMHNLETGGLKVLTRLPLA